MHSYLDLPSLLSRVIPTHRFCLALRHPMLTGSQLVVGLALRLPILSVAQEWPHPTLQSVPLRLHRDWVFLMMCSRRGSFRHLEHKGWVCEK